MKKWKLVNSKTLLDTKWLTVEQNDYDTGGGVIKKDYYDLKRPDYLLIIGRNKAGHIILERQYRRGVNEVLWELPAGWINKDESPVQAAERELREETGYQGKGKLLGVMVAQPGFMNMRAYVVEVEITGEGALDFEHDENIQKKSVPVKKVKDMIRKGEIVDMGFISAVNLFLLKKQN